MTNMFADNSQEVELNTIREKYQNNPDEMIKALAHAQSHIKKIETENADYRTKVTQSKTLEEVLETIKSNVPPQSQTPTSLSTPSVLDENTLNQKVEELFQKRTEAQQLEDNKRLVQTQMLAAYGEPAKAAEVMRTKAAELGMTVAELDEFAVRKPKAFLQFFGLSDTQSSVNVAPSRTTVNRTTTSTPQNGLDPYKAMVRDNREKFLSAEVQKEIMAEALKNPAKFGINI